MAYSYHIKIYGFNQRCLSSGKITESGGTLIFNGTGIVTTFQATVSGSTLTIKTTITYTANGATQTIPANSTGTISSGGLEGAWKADGQAPVGNQYVTSYIIGFSGENFWIEMKGTHPSAGAFTTWYKGTFTSDDSNLDLALTHTWSDVAGRTWEPTPETISAPYSINGDAFTFAGAPFKRTSAPAMPQ